RVVRPGDLQVTGIVDGQVGLGIDQRGDIELGRAARTIAGVDRIEGQLVVFVATIGGADIQAPDGRILEARTDGQRGVFVTIAVLRNGAVGVERGDVVGVVAQQRRRI